MMTRLQIANELKNNNKYIILTHENPDGDTIGSALSLAESLKLSGREAFVFGLRPIPKSFDFLSGFDEIMNTEETEVRCYIGEGYTPIFVDFAHFERSGLDSFPDGAKIIAIDHHQVKIDPNHYAVIEPETASASELVYQILKLAKLPITASIGNAVMTGILTDSGSFHYPNVTKETFEIAYELVELGVDISYVSEMIYERASIANRRLLGIALSRMKVSENGKFVTTRIEHTDIEKTGANRTDLDFIIDEVRKLSGMEVYILGKEYKPGEFRISLRGRGKISLNKFAKKFGGGGHINAAGLTLHGTWEEIEQTLIDGLTKELQI
ncbi:MAG: bifunctional oligoribonuclease/PAP phosphatase NrnA [Caldisericia bacterium]